MSLGLKWSTGPRFFTICKKKKKKEHSSLEVSQVNFLSRKPEKANEICPISFLFSPPTVPSFGDSSVLIHRNLWVYAKKRRCLRISLAIPYQDLDLDLIYNFNITLETLYGNNTKLQTITQKLVKFKYSFLFSNNDKNLSLV